MWRMRFKDLLKGRVPGRVYEKIPSSYDVIGEVAIVKLPEEALQYAELIGNAILRINRWVKGVYTKIGTIENKFRTSKLLHIAGLDLDFTVHREYGCSYFIYFKQVYFNPRLSFEHYRVSNIVRDGETVLDMFSGVGAFSIQIAYRRNVRILAFDLNWYANMSLKESLKLNRLKGEIHVLNVDSKTPPLHVKVDRVIMDIPEYAPKFLDVVCNVLREDGGVVHYYRFSDTYEHAIIELSRIISKHGRRVARILDRRVVLEASPSKRLYAIDAYIM